MKTIEELFQSKSLNHRQNTIYTGLCQQCKDFFYAFQICSLCSRKCVHECQKKGYYITCPVCKKVVYKKCYGFRKKAKTHFCSFECRYKLYVGKNHYSWKG